MMRLERKLGAAGIAAALTLAANAANADQPGWGTSAAASNAAVLAGPAAGSSVSPSQTYKNAHFASGGVALRNRGGGTIVVSGVAGPVKAAWLYWGVITQGAPKKANETVTLSAFFPGPSSSTVKLKGSSVGKGPSPCWLGNTTTIFRAAVPTSLFAAGAGNGLFQLTLQSGASGLTDNSDPFAIVGGTINSPLPEMEGASLVVIGAGSSTVAIYDKGFAGQMFANSSGLSYSLKLPVSAASAASVLFDEIGADGQIYVTDLVPDSGLASKVTAINTTPIAGGSAADPIPDWDGLSGVPLPLLWDDTEHDVTAAAKSGGSSMAVSITLGSSSTANNPSDCVVTVANVVEILAGSTD
jgi:hypothetical protein